MIKDSCERKSTEVAIIGAGIVGLTNALQIAKRGMQVTIIDDLQRRSRSFKVGESFLVFTSAFLRTVGGLDEFISERSFIKLGVWFTSGAEHQQDFSNATEWAVNADPHPPHYLYDLAEDKKWFRCMFLDMQIVRPEAEDVLLSAVRAHPLIRVIDTARVADVDVAEGDAPHRVYWYEEGQKYCLEARWVLDCSGRNRLLANRLGHVAERRNHRDAFQTTAVWAQFGGVDEAKFDERWMHLIREGQATQRDLYTVHLWGQGYWIWVIRLSDNRISIGATFDRRMPPPGHTPREQFWNLIRRYPVLDEVIGEETLLEFQVSRKVQHWTDTFVSEKRYAMVGDAASIIDAYYSQGIALALVTSWHIANVMHRDLRDAKLDRRYIERINRATCEDWKILRNMIREKYTVAIEDSRFFLLSHILDMTFFWSMGSTRASLTQWLVQTEGDARLETEELRRARKRLESRLFYSRSPYWLGLPPRLVQGLQRHLQSKLADRARWRIENGVRPPRVTCVLSVTAPVPKLWRLFFVRSTRGHVDISGHDMVQPISQRQPGTATWFDRLPISTTTRLNWVIKLRPLGLLALFVIGYAWDGLDTSLRKLSRRSRTGLGLEPAHAPEQNNSST